MRRKFFYHIEHRAHNGYVLGKGFVYKISATYLEILDKPFKKVRTTADSHSRIEAYHSIMCFVNPLRESRKSYILIVSNNITIKFICQCFFGGHINSQ